MPLKWYDLTDRSVLMDEETKKVIGQAVPIGLNWLGFDNDRDDLDGVTARPLGRFRFLEQAKTAIEQLAVPSDPQRVGSS